MVLYHVTQKRWMDRILREGIRPLGGSADKAVYLTDKKGIRDIIDYWVRM